MDSGKDLVMLKRQGARADLFLDRVERRNALSTGLLEAIRSFFIQEAQAGEPARAVVLRSNGPAFSAGSDFDELDADISTGAKDHTSEASQMESAFRAIEAYPYPVIARLHGGVFGAGCMLACACDIRVGVKGLKFSKNPAKLGLIYPPVGMGRLIRTVGPVFAKEMLLTGSVYDDTTALERGLVTHLVEEEEADRIIRDMTDSICQLSPDALRAMKEMFRLLEKDPVDRERLKVLHEKVSTGAQAVEGVRAMVEKRKPVWR